MLLDSFPKKILLIGAIWEEISPFSIFDNPKIKFYTAVTGIGLVASAISTIRLLDKFQPDWVIFCGSAGSANIQTYPLESVFIPKQTVLTGPEILTHGSYFPHAMPVQWDFYTPQEWISIPFREALPFSVTLGGTIGTTLAISQESHHQRQYVENGLAGEHLEIASIIAACTSYQIPCSAILGISNEIGPQAHQQWKQYRNKAEKNACQAAQFLLSDFYMGALS